MVSKLEVYVRDLHPFIIFFFFLTLITGIIFKLFFGIFNPLSLIYQIFNSFFFVLLLSQVLSDELHFFIHT